MRLGALALAAAVAWTHPAGATEFVQFAGGGVADYTTEIRYPYWTPDCGLDSCVSHTQASFIVNFGVEVDDLGAVNTPGWFADFSYGSYYSIGVLSGRVVSLGNGAFTGVDFQSAQGNVCAGFGPCVRTTGATATFAVRQVAPPPVPEPSTWAMLLIGFGAIGGGMRAGRRSTLAGALIRSAGRARAR